jgi:hypothetical protein
VAEVRYRITAKDQTKKATQSAQKNVGGLKKSAAGLGKSFASALVPIASVTAGLAALTKTISDSVKAYSKQEEAVTRLTSALQASGAEVESVSAELQAHASALQEVTTFGDEAIIQQQSFLASLGYTKNEIKELTTAAVNLASSGMVTLDSAVKNLVRTKSGLSGELGEIIPQIRNLTKEELEAGEAIDVVQKQFDGMAESLADTGVGALKQYRNAMGDLKEQMGQSLVNAIRPFVEGLTTIITKLTTAIEKQRTYNEVVKNMATGDKKTPMEKLGVALEEAEKELARWQEKLERAQKRGRETSAKRYQGEINDVQDLIDAIKAEMSARTAAQRYQAQGEEEKRKAAEKEAAAAEQHRKDLEKLNEYYDKTKQGQIDALQATINYFEEFKKGPKAVAVLNMLYEKMEELRGKTEEATKELMTYISKMGRFSGKAGFIPRSERPGRSPRGDMGSTAPSSPASSPTDVTGAMSPFIGALKDAAGKLEGFSGTLAQSVLKHGPEMGILMASLNRVLGRLVEILNPLLNTILEPATQFLDWIADTLASYIIPVLQLLSPVLQTVIAAFKVFSAVIFQPVMLILNLLMPAIKVLADMFTWFYSNIIAPVGKAIVKAFEIAGNIVITIVNSLIHIWNGTVAPVLYEVGKVFAWFHNKVIRPVGNAILGAIDTVVNGLIGLIRKLIKKINDALGTDIKKPGKIDVKGGGIGKIKVDENFGRISPADRLDFGGFMPGAPTDTTYTGPGGDEGTQATYQRARPIKINVYVEGNHFNGAGGLREFVQLIRDELESLEVLQV